MAMQFTGANIVPGIGAVLSTVEKVFLWGLREQQVAKDCIIGGAARDNGNSPTDVLRPGLLLGRNSSTGKCYQWSPTANDGTEKIYGINLWDQKMQLNSVDADRFLGFALLGGNVQSARLLIPGNASYGIAGDALEFLVRAYLTQNGRFRLDDNPSGVTAGGWKRFAFDLTNHSTYNGTPTPATVTLTSADHDTLFVMTAATKAINVTLPVMVQGLRFAFYVDADQSLTLTANPADSLVVFNDIAADTVALSTSSKKVGGFFECLGMSGGKTLVIPHTWSDGTNTQTITLAT